MSWFIKIVSCFWAWEVWTNQFIRYLYQKYRKSFTTTKTTIEVNKETNWDKNSVAIFRAFTCPAILSAVNFYESIYLFIRKRGSSRTFHYIYAALRVHKFLMMNALFLDSDATLRVASVIHNAERCVNKSCAYLFM